MTCTNCHGRGLIREAIYQPVLIGPMVVDFDDLVDEELCPECLGTGSKEIQDANMRRRSGEALESQQQRD